MEEKAWNGTLLSLAFLEKVTIKEEALTRKKRLLIRKDRQSVSKFKRIYGSTFVLLGAFIPVEFVMAKESVKNSSSSKGG